MPLSLRRVCDVKQSKGKRNLQGNFSFIKSILSFAFPPIYVDAEAINWALLVNIETFIY